MKPYKYIELFAGCGGLSLGLKAADFDLIFANELSPMAGETYAFNILNENIKETSNPKKMLWINSGFKKGDQRRLMENPNSAIKGSFSDLDNEIDLFKKLLIGDINQLNNFLNHHKSIIKKLQDSNIDLVSGGPPCQSFSLAGRREKDNKKNLLPLSFAHFVGIVKPKIVLLENVKGITSPFTIEGEKYYAWVEVAKAFCLEGFIPICMMLNSKYFGIPQNRPRFILLALRKDIYQSLLKNLNDENTLIILKNSNAFFKKVLENKNSLNKVTKHDLELYDIEKVPDLFNGKILPSIVTKKDEFISAIDAIDDLSDNIDKKNISKYVTSINELFKSKKSVEINERKNHEIRKHGFNVKARFRWFQITSKLNGLSPYALKILSGEFLDEEKMNAIFQKINGEQILVKDANGDKLVTINNYETFIDYIKSIQSRKHSQRAIKENEPAPAQLTIPDDLCHYSSKQLRTLTVREMARFQSFPDWFEFKSKVTTGGTSRSVEVNID
jgi:DNA (cytosine-5)-methyltransferase 1